MPIDWSQVSDAQLSSEVGRRNQAKRKTKGGGRPPKKPVEAPRKLRTEVYYMLPYDLELNGCPRCHNPHVEWSEFEEHLWCQRCEIDFKPVEFYLPVQIEIAHRAGYCYARVDIATGKYMRGPCCGSDVPCPLNLTFEEDSK